MVLQVLVLFVVLDYITGLVAAYEEQNLNSRVGLRRAKDSAFVPVAVAYWLDMLLGQEIPRNLAYFLYRKRGPEHDGEPGPGRGTVS